MRHEISILYIINRSISIRLSRFRFDFSLSPSCTTRQRPFPRSGEPRRSSTGDLCVLIFRRNYSSAYRLSAVNLGAGEKSVRASRDVRFGLWKNALSWAHPRLRVETCREEGLTLALGRPGRLRAVTELSCTRVRTAPSSPPSLICVFLNNL